MPAPKYLWLALFAIPSQAGALDGEVSVGATVFQKQPDGVWYQSPFPHSLHMASASGAIGVADYLTENVRFHFGYRYLGHVSSEALAVADDAVYAKYGADASKHLVLGTWVGYGSVNMIYATLAPEYRYGAWRFAVELGGTVYRPTWTERIYNYQAHSGDPLTSFTVVHDPKLLTGYTVGVSVGYKNVECALSVYDIRSSGDTWPALYHGLATNLSLRYVIRGL